jgi:hypothetical protein
MGVGRRCGRLARLTLSLADAAGWTAKADRMVEVAVLTLNVHLRAGRRLVYNKNRRGSASAAKPGRDCQNRFF